MKIVSNFEHLPGKHCGSTAMRNLLRWRGVEMSEAMVMGLGSGLGFVYLRGDGLNPSRSIMGRTWNLEENVANALGMSLLEHTTDDAEEGWQRVKIAIDDDTPVMVQCDLVHLPYWGSNTPFNGHRILVVGYDEDRQVAMIADTHFEGLQEVPLESLAKSRRSFAAPMGYARHASWTLDGSVQNSMEDAIVRSLLLNAETMTVDSDFAGMGAMRVFADEVGQWVERPDAAWCFRFAYQCLERRGTGGGNFRRLYRDFLMESLQIVPAIKKSQLHVGMSRAAAAWTTLAEHFEIASRTEVPEGSAVQFVESLSEAVYQFESMFWDMIPDVFGDKP